MNDPRDPQTETQIRRALSARAQEVSVSPNAFDKIRSETPTSPWSRPLAYAAVAAIVVVLLVGAALLTSPREDGSSIDDSADQTTTVPPDTTAPPSTSTPTTSTPPSTTTTTTTTTLPDTAPGSTVFALGEPLRIDPATTFRLWDNVDGLPAAAAVEAFIADRFGLVDVPITPTTIDLAPGVSSDGVEAFGVHRRAEDGSFLDTFAFKVITHTPADGIPQVRLVVSSEFEIYDVTATETGYQVTGEGRAYEGTATLEFQGGQQLLAVGSIEFGEFTAPVDYLDHCPCEVTIIGATALDDEVPTITSFRVNPVLESAPLPFHAVFGVADDDVLNVRSGPGVDNPIVTTFAPDATGIEVSGNSAMVGSSRWVEVRTEDAPGWVNSRFLVAVPDGVSTHAIEGQLQALQSMDAAFADVVDAGGIGVYADFPTPWTAVRPDEFDEARNWSPEGTEDRCPTCTATLEEFLGFDTAKWDLAEYTVGSDLDPTAPNFLFFTGQHPAFFDRYVTGTIHIPEPNPDESLDWRRYTVVFDVEAGSPIVRGIWRWGWTP